MTFTEAAAEVLRLAGKPLHYKEITELAIEKNLLSHVGKSPEVTMGARLAALLKKDDKANPIMRVKPGVFALREWDEKKGRRSKEREPEVEQVANDDQENEVNALEVEAATAARAPEKSAEARGAAAVSFDDEREEAPRERAEVSGEDARLTELAASGAELFDDEEDDDQPILAPSSAAGPQSGTADPAGDGGRRRRRRRRRGRGERNEPFAGAPHERQPHERQSTPRLAAESGAQAGQAAQTTIVNGNGSVNADGEAAEGTTRDLFGPPPRAIVRDRQQIMAGGAPTGIDVPLGDGEELAGRELADATLMVLTAFDRNAGPVPLRAIVDQLVRRGRLTGDPATAQSQLSASLRADNLRRTANGQRPRFRFAAGVRVAPTDWSLGTDLARLEADVINAVERYRESARRTLLRRLQELPGHAFVELAILALERVGMSGLKAVRRAGSPGGEAHFSALHRTGTDEIRTAIIIRKDGREIGRERVSDLRGALHHYGPANAGWLVTTGQVLSGAREEAGAIGAAPLALYDGLSFCKLLEDHEVGIVRTRFHVAIPDLELLEAIRG